MNNQTSFKQIQISLKHGGELSVGRRKIARPLSSKRPIHLVLRSSSPIFNRRLKEHRSALQVIAKKFNINLYGYSFNFNHVHAVILSPNRKSYAAFIRLVTAKMASISGRTKIFPFRPFTRIVSWGRDFKNLATYLKLNDLENYGIPKSNGRILKAIWDSDPPL